MDTIKIAVCEDEDKEYNRLLELLNNCKYTYTITRYTEGQSLLDEYYPYKFNLILMDIYMNGLNGVETVAKIRNVDKITTIAFTTTSLAAPADISSILQFEELLEELLPPCILIVGVPHLGQNFAPSLN